MDLKAKYLSETCSDPIEYLRQLRQTTEPIGGGTVYSEDGELVEYEVALEAVRKANNALKVKEVQEEHVSIWHDSSKETPTQGSNILMIRKEEGSDFPPIAGCFHGTNSRSDGRNWGYYNGFCYNEIEPPMKWAYVDDLLNLSNVERTVKDWKEEPVNEDFDSWYEKEWVPFRHSSYTTKDKLEEAFKAGAKWQKEQLMANTVDTMIGLPYENKDGGYTHLIDVSRPLPVGNNKIAIIFKED